MGSERKAWTRCFDRPDTLPAAIQGIETMFLITPSTERQFAQETTAIDAARQVELGVRCR